jgi:hypothetical protein
MSAEHDEPRIVATTCAEVSGLLPSLATLAVFEKDYAAIYPEAMAHIAACAECREAWDDLRELAQLAYSDQVAAAPAYPTFALPNRPAQPAQPPQAQFGQAVRRTIMTLTHSLLDSLRQPSAAGAWRGRLLYLYHPDLAFGDLTARLEIFAETDDETMTTLRIYIANPAADAFEQAGIAVKAWADTTTWSGTTDPSGWVILTGIPHRLLPCLRIEIIPPESGDAL